MAKYEKPDAMNVIWASEALSVDIERPDDEEIRIGWEQEIPPYQTENWSMNKLHQAIAYINQMGLIEWDDNTEYQQDKSIVQASDGNIYRCTATHTNRNPAGGVNADYWERFRGDRLATTEQTGVVELATPAEVNAGSRDDVAVTPYSLGEGYTGNPVGVVIMFAGQVAPEGYFEADGRELSTSEYPDLFTAIGYIYGGSGGTFRIPDMRGEFVRGLDSGRGVDGGRSLGSHQSHAIQSHNHTGYTGTDGRHRHSGSTGTAGNHYHTGYTEYDGNHSHSGSTSSNGNHRHQIPEGEDNGDDSYSPYASGDDFTPSVRFWSWSRNAGNHNHSLHINNAGNHRHELRTYSSGNHSHSVSIGYDGDHRHYFSTNETGGSETRPRNIAMMFCIKYE